MPGIFEGSKVTGSVMQSSYPINIICDEGVCSPKDNTFTVFKNIIPARGGGVRHADHIGQDTANGCR